jgi:hypothetical protein
MRNYTKEQILEKIERARLEKAEDLDFSNSGLQQLPPEIGQLTNLQTLSGSDQIKMKVCFITA